MNALKIFLNFIINVIYFLIKKWISFYNGLVNRVFWIVKYKLFGFFLPLEKNSLPKTLKIFEYLNETAARTNIKN